MTRLCAELTNFVPATFIENDKLDEVGGNTTAKTGDGPDAVKVLTAKRAIHVQSFGRFGAGRRRSSGRQRIAVRKSEQRFLHEIARDQVEGRNRVDGAQQSAFREFALAPLIESLAKPLQVRGR
jgi:hypothetical protein